jgi:excisionase family DNA binding protein
MSSLNVDTSIMPPLLISIEEASRMLAVSKHAIFNWVYVGKIKTVKLGSRRCVPYSEVQRIAERGLEEN